MTDDATVAASVSRLVDTARRSADRAAATADVIRGVPAFLSMWSVLDGIARDLRRVVDDFDRTNR